MSLLDTVDLSNALGTEVRGIDLSQPLPEDVFQEIRLLVSHRGVLVFRRQSLSPTQQVAFSRRLGTLKVPPLVDHWVLDGHPEVMRISNVLDEQGRHIGNPDAGVLWHSDGTYQKEPSMYTLLHAMEVPQRDGRTLGNTLYASTTAAYAALSDDMKARIANLRAIHSLSHEYDKKAAAGHLKRDKMSDDQKHQLVPEVTHPLVRTHPITGAKCIYASEAVTIGIEGWPSSDAEPLIKELTDFCTRDEFVYRHEWQVGDFVFWDNCPTQHRALFDYELPQRRLMHRTTVAGSAPF